MKTQRTLKPLINSRHGVAFQKTLNFNATYCVNVYCSLELFGPFYNTSSCGTLPQLYLREGDLSHYSSGYLGTQNHAYLQTSWLCGPLRALASLITDAHSSFHCLLSPSINLHLPYILFNISQPSQSRPSLSSFSFRFTRKCFLTYPSMIHSFALSALLHRPLCADVYTSYVI
jgi:hypothetical protein